MAGADHRRQRLVRFFAVGGRRRIGPEPFAPGKAKRRFLRSFAGMGARRSSVILLDPSCPKRLSHAPFAITPRAKDTRLRQSISRIVDEPCFRRPLDDLRDRRMAAACPAAFAQLAAKVIGKLGAASGEARDIGQPKLLQRRFVERWPGAAGLSGAHVAMFVPQSVTITQRQENAAS